MIAPDCSVKSSACVARAPPPAWSCFSNVLQRDFTRRLAQVTCLNSRFSLDFNQCEFSA